VSKLSSTPSLGKTYITCIWLPEESSGRSLIVLSPAKTGLEIAIAFEPGIKFTNTYTIPIITKANSVLLLFIICLLSRNVK
jgi:hypothetical protein